MGANNSNLKAAVVEEYKRCKDPSREHLVLHDLLAFAMPNLVQLELTHIGVLFVMDSDRSGQYTSEKLLMFFDLCAEHARFYRPHEFQAQIQGYCALQLWNCVASKEGKMTFQEWFAKLIQESERAHHVEQHPGPEFASRDTIQDLYEILSVSDHHGMNFQSFFDLLQRVGEEKGRMHPDDEALDDYAPLEVLQDFATSFILGFREGLNLDVLE